MYYKEFATINDDAEDMGFKDDTKEEEEGLDGELKIGAEEEEEEAV